MLFLKQSCAAKAMRAIFHQVWVGALQRLQPRDAVILLGEALLQAVALAPELIGLALAKDAGALVFTETFVERVRHPEFATALPAVYPSPCAVFAPCSAAGCRN